MAIHPSSRTLGSQTKSPPRFQPWLSPQGKLKRKRSQGGTPSHFEGAGQGVLSATLGRGRRKLRLPGLTKVVASYDKEEDHRTV